MCLSGLTQILYGILMGASVALTAIALFTPNWNTLEKNLTGKHVWHGLMPWSCIDNYNGETCKDWWSNLPTWMRCVVVCMILALIVQVVGSIYNFLTCLSCCCKKYLIHPLTFFSTISTILLLIAVIVYACEYKDIGHIDTSTQLGYSFWLAVASLLCSAASVIVGAVTVFFGQHCC